jgi:hypothetical protein
MARCYANENFPFPTVEALRSLGHYVLTTVESGQAGQAIPDADVLAFAVPQGRTVMTLNRRHFIRLHHTTPTHAGIIVCTSPAIGRKTADSNFSSRTLAATASLKSLCRTSLFLLNIWERYEKEYPFDHCTRQNHIGYG